MIALDTNLLVYAHREEYDEHPAALTWVEHLAASGAPWGLPAMVLAEFVRVVTHPRALDAPTEMERALSALEALTSARGARVLGAGPRFAHHFAASVRAGRAIGSLAFDAHIAAVCREHCVSRLVTRDRDFSRFPWIQIVDIDEDPADFV